VFGFQLCWIEWFSHLHQDMGDSWAVARRYADFLNRVPKLGFTPVIDGIRNPLRRRYSLQGSDFDVPPDCDFAIV
jgi:hypothetical protein